MFWQKLSTGAITSVTNATILELQAVKITNLIRYESGESYFRYQYNRGIKTFDSPFPVPLK